MTLAFALPIDTPRLQLRRVARRDLADLLLVNDDEAVNLFLPYPRWRSMADAQGWYERMNGLQADGSTVQLVLVRRDDDRVVGSALVFRHDAIARRAELGYVLGSAHWGAGYMIEALDALVDTVFREAAVDLLEAVVEPANAASVRVLRRLGFRRDHFDPAAGTQRLRLASAARLARPRLALEAADADGIPALIAELDAYLATLYPPESNHGLDLDALAAPNVILVVARDANAQPQGCGALVMHDDWAEIKRMFVRPALRGEGLGDVLLSRLEHEARARGAQRLLLETGISQPEALGLYAAAGYLPCPPFGDYRPDPLSVFLRKEILPPA